MATKPEIIKAIDDKIITKGNISAVDTNKILKDMLEFSDKPATPVNGFDFGNLKSPLFPNDKMSVKMNFTGIEKFSCSLYLCVETKYIPSTSTDGNKNAPWIFLPLEDKQISILESFLPNINKREMYLTFLVPFFATPTEIIIDNNNGGTDNPTNNNVVTKANTRNSDFPMMIIGLGLITNLQNQTGVHLVLPEQGHISTSVTLSYKSNEFKLDNFAKDTATEINKIFNSIINDNDLDMSNNK